jgi:hypothetical protein
LPDNSQASQNFTEVMAGDAHSLSPFHHEAVSFVLHIGKDGKDELWIVSEFEKNVMNAMNAMKTS